MEVPWTGPPLEPKLLALLQCVTRRHLERYGEYASWVAWAPGRVNLIGEHTDYNEGYVLPIAIDEWTVVAATSGPDRRWVVWSDQFPDEPAEFSLPPGPGEPSWSNYVRGVIAWAMDRGVTVPGLRVTVVSSVPVGGGLSSSAALEVAVASLIEVVAGEQFDPLQKAIGCQWAEHRFAGTPCGLMDQMAATFGQRGHALLIDCRTNRVRPVPLDLERYRLIVFDTGVRHELGASEYPQRRQACREAADILARRFPHVWTLRDATRQHVEQMQAQLGEPRYRRARHVVTENERTIEAAAALVQADYDRFGRLMFESHRSLRDDYEVSCAELDLLVDQAEAAGALGARMTGGGFGGCAIALATAEAASELQAQVAERFRERYGRPPAVFEVQAVYGTAALGA